MRRVVVSAPWMDSASGSSELDLDPEGARRLARVLRAKVGDRIEVLDAQGRVAAAEVIEVHAGVVRLRVGDVSRIETDRSLEIHVLAPIPKGDRWDWLLQKCTELGATRLSPITTARTQWKVPAAKVEGRRRRWNRIVAEAARQSRRYDAPVVDVPISLDGALAGLAAAAPTELRLVAVAGGGDSPRRAVAEVFADRDRAAVVRLRVLVGPEGGLTAQEVGAAGRAGFIPVSLGPRILRVETAAMTLVGLGQYELGDLS